MGSNLHNYNANPVPFDNQKTGGLLSVNSAIDMTPNAILGYKPFEKSALYYLFVGVKLSVLFDIPKPYKCRCEKESIKHIL